MAGRRGETAAMIQHDIVGVKEMAMKMGRPRRYRNRIPGAKRGRRHRRAAWYITIGVVVVVVARL